MVWICYIVMIVVPYLLGGINTSIIVMKLTTHKDIREMGSRNAGLTNTLRTGGKSKAAIVLLGDVAKAVLAMFAVRLFFFYAANIDTSAAGDFKWIEYIACFMTVVGHIFPVYYGFKGGKGVLAAISAIFVMDWRTGAVLLGVFIVIVAITRYVSLGSCVSSGLCVFSTLFFGLMFDKNPGVIICAAFAAFTGGLIIFMHRGNIARLAAGTEKKLGEKETKG